jgi:hypothetical protein
MEPVTTPIITSLLVRKNASTSGQSIKASDETSAPSAVTYLLAPDRPLAEAAPCRPCGAFKPTERISAWALNNKAGKAFLLSIPTRAFRPSSKRHCTTGPHLTLNRRPLNPVQQVGHPKGPQEMAEVIQQRPFVQPVNPTNGLLAISASCHQRDIASCGLPP